MGKFSQDSKKPIVLETVNTLVPDELWERLQAEIPELRPAEFTNPGCPPVSARTVIAVWLWSMKHERAIGTAPHALLGCSKRTVSRRINEWRATKVVVQIATILAKYRRKVERKQS